MLGNKIKQARIANGFSLRALAEKTNDYVSAQVIHQYELNLKTPGSDVLISLAKALGVKVEYFFRPSEIEVRLSEPSYRKRASAPIKLLKSVRAQTQEQIEKYLEIESLFPSNRFSKFEMPIDDERNIESIDDIEKFTRHLRRLWMLGSDPIENLINTLEDRGVKVVLLDTDGKIDGLSCWANDRIPVIVVKKNQPGDRMRFSIVHELGHLLMHIRKSIDVEKAAHRFAASFLVPKDVAFRELGVKRHSFELLELELLKMKYGMSMQAWIYRARDLGIISESYFVRLNSIFRKKGWSLTEPGKELQREEPTRFRQLVMQAVAEDLISPGRAAELLNEPLNTFRKSILNQFE